MKESTTDCNLKYEVISVFPLSSNSDKTNCTIKGLIKLKLLKRESLSLKYANLISVCGYILHNIALYLCLYDG